MYKLYYILVFLFLVNSVSFCQESEEGSIPDTEDSLILKRLGDTIPTVSIFTGRYIPVKDSIAESNAITLLNKAYLLAGADWDAVIITHLKEGSRVLIENTNNGWSYVRVYSEPGNEEIKNKRVTGFINNKAIGLKKNGKPIK